MQGGLFDDQRAELEPTHRDPARCEHQREAPTVTVWPGERVERLTMLCCACGRVRGRYPGER
jgi:hypothetical protein